MKNLPMYLFLANGRGFTYAHPLGLTRQNNMLCEAPFSFAAH